MRNALVVVTLVLAALGAVLDLTSVVLEARRRRRGTGPSGIAGASLFMYFPYCVAQRQGLLFVGLAAFHVVCHWIIPRLDRPAAE